MRLQGPEVQEGGVDCDTEVDSYMGAPRQVPGGSLLSPGWASLG